MCYSTAKELRDNINQMYSDFGNQSQVNELEDQIKGIQQGENTVTKYFNTLKGLWQDLDLFMDYEWKCSEDGKHIKMECSRIFKFLAGLNLDIDEVRGRIIGRQPLPPIREVFSEVRREESRRSVMLGKKTIVVEIENSALATSTANATRQTSNIPKWTDEKTRFGVIFTTSLNILVKHVDKFMESQLIGNPRAKETKNLEYNLIILMLLLILLKCLL